MTADTPSNDGFHEIQLSGKQLVFLFMAATVASVVVFLCGVLVGRGVRDERAAVAQAEALQQSPTPDIQAPLAGAGASLSADADPREVLPPPLPDDLTYGERLEEPNRATDDLKPAAPRAAVVARGPRTPPVGRPTPAGKASVAEKAPAAEKANAAEKAQPAPAAAPASGAGAGYAVQVAALNVRGEADVIAKRLSSKGYSAYVQTPPGGTPAVFRVRVGSFKTRREAETVAARLQKEEQITPWVTR